MLKLVLGGSGSGKTTLLYARIKARAEAGQRSILLVPEQFTSSTEGRIYRELGDALSGMVDSYSFTSLAEHILSAEGGAAVQTLSDAGRAVLVRRTLEELQKQNIWAYAVTMDGEDYNDVDFSGGVALVIGAEGEGISRLTLEKCDRKVSLPMKGVLDSLNASVAAGVMMYRVLASRGHKA